MNNIALITVIGSGGVSIAVTAATHQADPGFAVIGLLYAGLAALLYYFPKQEKTDGRSYKLGAMVTPTHLPRIDASTVRRRVVLPDEFTRDTAAMRETLIASMASRSRFVVFHGFKVFVAFVADSTFAFAGHTCSFDCHYSKDDSGGLKVTGASSVHEIQICSHSRR